MRVGILGINHKLADLKLRETLARVCQRHFGAANLQHEGHSLVLLSTCNRTEVYFSSEDLAETHSYLLQILRQDIREELDQKLYSFFGYDCFLHLARVTSGLDSAVIAETEIQGQVKGAYEFAAEFLSLPAELHYLFQKALKTGKQVRSSLLMKRGLPDVEHAIHSSGSHFFGLKQPKILFVGASEINRKTLIHLNNRNAGKISVCNRTQEVAEDWSATYGVEMLPWQELHSWHTFDWIIFGTKAGDYLITPDHIPQAMCEQKLIVDLSVPRNVAPSTACDKRVTLLNIDQINRSLRIRRRRLIDNLIQAEEQLAEAAKLQVGLYQEKERRRQVCFSA